MLNTQADLFDDVGPSSFAQNVKFHKDGDFVYRHMTLGETTYSECVSSYYKFASDRDDFFLSYLNGSLTAKTTPTKKLNYIDLFCGGGGLSLGVQNAARFLGYSPKLNLAADIDKHALGLTSAHFKPVFARNKSVEELVRYEVDLTGENSNFVNAPLVTDHQIKELKGRVDLLVGGPPCQGHSNLNNKTRRFDPRNLLYFVMPAFAVALDIPNIIIENVRTINKASENVVEITKNILEFHGYSVSEFILTASDFGVAQSRTRHFLIASKRRSTDQSIIINSFKGSPISFNSACVNMPVIPEGLSFIEEASVLSKENQRRINFLHDNDFYDLPNFARPDCHQDGTTYQSVYGRIKGDLPMTTITTGFGSPGRGRYIHPFERRPISIREAGRVQAFPDWYWEKAVDLSLSRSHFQKIVGDAVPSLLVYPLMAALFA